ncbi:MAG: hypothetical protein LBS99_06355 [Clostridiales bacterium]|nr:hypothetical protein [Clostridiales bacterium]
MKELEEAMLRALEIFEEKKGGVKSEKVAGKNWVRWIHPKADSTAITHCTKCVALEDCWLLLRKCPKPPLHTRCDCELEFIDDPIAGITASGNCAIEKFEKYIFHPSILKNLGKKKLFGEWGYDIMDSKYLKSEFEKQAVARYVSGEYELGV